MESLVSEMRAVAADRPDYILAHVGVGHEDGGESGRYPWGSGKKPFQHSGDFLSYIEGLAEKKFEWTDPETGKTYSGDSAIAKSMGLNRQQLEIQRTLAKNERDLGLYLKAKKMRENGVTNNSEIARAIGKNESVVRSWFKNGEFEGKKISAQKLADDLKKIVDEKGMISVSKGTHLQLNTTETQLKSALYLLEREGYNTYMGRVPRNNKDQGTTISVLTPPGTAHKEIFNFENIHYINDYISRDGGQSLEKKFEYPASLDSKRLRVRYAEDGGIDKDGMIELRRGVDDLSLGNNRVYSQVRIMVDGTHYLKGMAVYADDKDFPPGVDVIFNTNKKLGTPVMDLETPKRDRGVLKPIKNDPDNPFGSNIKDKDLGGQYHYTDKDGNIKLGLINKRADEGDWDEWKNKVPSQFLAKQNIELVKQQLSLAKEDKQAEYDTIAQYNNPTVRSVLLESFASDCDSAAVHLQAAAFPRQRYSVILSEPSLKETEVYAPNFEHGEKLALVRYPHAGPFEIPILTVNNKNKKAESVIGKNPMDAVMINPRVAEQLSGADFDGDTVMCIPTAGNGRNLNINIKNRPPLEGLKDFDPKAAYPERAGMKYMSKEYTQKQMGEVSNLITDMYNRDAPDGDLAKAVRHSMVVIDAHKHKLDYVKSEKENDIAALKRKYQGHYDENGKYHEGASSLMSRAKNEATVLKRQGTPKTDPETGDLIYKVASDSKLYYAEKAKYDKQTGEITMKVVGGPNVTYNVKNQEDRDKYTPVMRKDPDTGRVYFTDRDGGIEYKTIARTQKSTKMAEAKDARSLISDAHTAQEEAYADYANYMKDLARTARLGVVHGGKLAYSKEAYVEYKTEVAELNSKLRICEANAPKESQALTLTNAEMKAIRQSNPDMSKKEDSKKFSQVHQKYRDMVGASRQTITFTDRQWEAIQKGAIHDGKLRRILKYADMDEVKQRATPRENKVISPAMEARIKDYKSNKYTNEQIAKMLGISTSSVSRIIKGK